MKDYLLLLRVNLKTMLRGSLTGDVRNEKGKIKLSYILLYILAAVGLLTFAGMIIFMETALYQTVAKLSLLPGLRFERLLIGLALLMSMIVTLLFGVFHTMGAMYFNRDTVATAHLPIGQRTQMAARWTEVYISELLFTLTLLLPMLINHGIAQGGGVLYYVGMTLIVLVTPVYPLAIALLLSSILARITSLTKHKEVWMVLGTVLALVIVLGGEWLLLPQIPDDADAMFFLQLLMDNQALLEFLIGAFPPVLWAVEAISGSVPMLALFAAAGVAAIALVIALTGGSFQSVCMKHTEHGTTRKAVSKSRKEDFGAVSPFKAIFRREMNEVMKTPVYLLNAVMGVLMMPIMLIAMSVGMTSAEEGIDLAAMLGKVVSKLAPTDLTLILAAVFSFMIFMCPITATAISREGKRLPTMRMIPVAPGQILWAKLAVGLAVIAFGSVIMGVAIVILLGVHFVPHVITAVVMANVLSVAVNIGNLLVDVLKPMLTWKSENEVMKQNFNVMWGMLIGVVMTALVVVPVLLLLEQAAWMRMAVAAVVLLGELGVMLVLLHKVGEPRLARLEP